jgi:hypothetical protein
MLLAAERWERAETTVLRALGLEAEPAGHWLGMPSTSRRSKGSTGSASAGWRTTSG